jgi:hypothetical protein
MNIAKNAFSLQEIKSIFKEKGQGVGDTIFDLFKCFKIAQLCRASGMLKLKGYRPSEILTVLFLFPFMLIDTVRGFIVSSYPLTQAKKDVFFRFLNDEWVNWRKMLYAAAKRFKALTADFENQSGVTCGIVDDTLIEKTGEKIEGIGKVFDHITRKWVLGFKCLLYCYWDGKSIYPLDFSFHAEKGKDRKRPYGLPKRKLKKRFSKERDAASPGAKRFKELYQNKIDAALALIKRAAKGGFLPRYLLCDSWFSSAKFIATVRKIKKGAIHFLGMVRQDKRCYVYDNQSHNAIELCRLLKSKAQRSRKLKSRYIEVVVEYQSLGEVKLFFSRFSRRGKWQLLLTTDLSLTYIKAMEIYSLRWGIEVLFKECKQHLNLGKCQSNDFDAQIAQASISFMLFTMLAFYKRVHAYETMGSLFAHLKDQLIEATIGEKLWVLFLELQILVAEIFEIDINEYFPKLLNSEKAEALLRSLLSASLERRVGEQIDKAA